MEKNEFWKKGDKVVRVFGFQKGMFGGGRGMCPGSVAALAEDQIYPGVVKLVGFPGDHDVCRLRRLEDYTEFSAEELSNLYNVVDNQGFEGVVQFIREYLRDNF